MNSFVKDMIALQEVYDQLQTRGYKNKDLAAHLEMFPSAFSTLINKVVKPIVKRSKESSVNEQFLTDLFTQVSNISEVKLKRRLSDYLKVLEGLLKQGSDHQQAPQSNFIEELIRSTPYDTLKVLEGMYDCYYLSTFGYRIKKEPFLLKFNAKENRYQVFKGNERGPARYSGFAYVSNPQLLTMQLTEAGTMLTDHFMAHFILPPTYSTTVNLLKGIAVSISNALLPASRKIILEKISDKTDLTTFNEQPTVFFEKEQGDDNPIVAYLRSHVSVLEYIPIPHPNYDRNDLKKEELVKNIQ
ncbi:hypothetical protein [Paraflavitalea pollutisoli]|uniref:hypothetical protein n=1 Tax=Paraflavitalea pollutisoli TaxID=3034143 RepID=UPI0023ED1179|nr:hypothetical protein [Paraflavitalea sp. H1-2-19X]